MKRPTPQEIAYRRERAERAGEAVRVAKVQRLGATVIKRRETAWKIKVAELECALRRWEDAA